MNATTTTLWTAAALLVPLFACTPASAALGGSALDSCEVFQFHGGIPEYHPECLPSSMVDLDAGQPADQNVSASP